ncbi:hypothetical protein CFP65_1446 [Kitasatospora sp. MMS16-BH015]|uniref:hypothetical protein n=1 Tax=Kitasatospora sp. MMS16-BH015 TaxID=2018025 RepID=UPI000CA2D345|nr:hypothetical protein [Kitasatospora sp. MMS16-BH015]AUG76344.1 hypothetical protein CFP65_1446 [Kitasatospora sp. MMS16-BH015]
MSFRDVVRALIRRWLVLVVVAVLALAGALVVVKPGVVYRSTAVIRIKPPETKQDPNGLTDFRPSLAIIGAAVVTMLKSQSGLAELRRAGVSGAYDLAPRNTGTTKTEAYVVPTVEVSVRGTDPKETDREVGIVIEHFDQHLKALQDGLAVPVPKDRYITSDELVPATALPVQGVKSRGLFGVAALATVVGVAAALWVEEYARRRRIRPEAGPETAPPGIGAARGVVT